MSRICLYYLKEPEGDRWLPYDRYIRPAIRRLIRGAPRPGGLDKVFINLCLGLDKLNIPYEVNLPFNQLLPEDRVGVLGVGRFCLQLYDRPNPIVAGVGLMTHPSEWLDLCTNYPVVKYLQHSPWANAVYQPYFGDRCTIWAVGIDTETWHPENGKNKTFDFLIYDKIRWEREKYTDMLLNPIRQLLSQKGLTFQELHYGNYKPEDYQMALSRARATIFLCEHESQGIAYQECLSSGIPILAWNPGECLDPNRLSWGMPYIPATSVPYWDDRCGVTFQNIDEFPKKLAEFIEKLNSNLFAPRNYILENLTLEKCAQHYLDILAEVNAGVV